MIIFQFRPETIGRKFGRRAHIKSEFMSTNMDYDEISVYYKFGAIGIWEINGSEVVTLKDRIIREVNSLDALAFALKATPF